MQLGLIVGIIFAIAAALFAMQNIAPDTVTVGFWSFEGVLGRLPLVQMIYGGANAPEHVCFTQPTVVPPSAGDIR